MDAQPVRQNQTGYFLTLQPANVPNHLGNFQANATVIVRFSFHLTMVNANAEVRNCRNCTICKIIRVIAVQETAHAMEINVSAANL